MASKAQTQLVSRNLETLRREGQTLVDSINSYIEEIICLGQSWVDKRGTDGPTFRQIITTVMESVTLIMEKQEDFTAGLSAEGEAEDLSLPPQQSSGEPSWSISSLETSTTSSSSSSTFPDTPRPSLQPSDQIVAQIMNRLDNIENDSVKIKDLDQRLGHMEKERREVDGETVKEVKDRLDRLEESLKDLPTFSEKVERVERRLQTVLRLDEGVRNLQKQTQADIQKIDDIKTEVTSLGEQLELSKKQHVGFVAQMPQGGPAFNCNPSTTVTAFTQVLSNKGDNYNPSTGEFTAPVDGLYVASITCVEGVVYVQQGKGSSPFTSVPLTQTYGGGSFSTTTTSSMGGGQRLQVVCKRQNAVPGVLEDVMCVTDTSRQKCKELGIVYMNAGDKLYVRSTGSGGIQCPSSFSCCLIC